MIDRASDNLARSIVKWGEFEQNQLPRIRFGMILFITTLLIVILTVAIGIITSSIMESLISLAALALLRYYSGGFHFKTSEQCVIFTVVLASTIPHLPILSNREFIICTLISLAILAIFAPSGILKKKISRNQSSVYKWISLAIVMTNFIFFSPILAYSYLFQSISTIRLTKGGDFQ